MYYSNLAAFQNAFREGADAGLIAAAEFYTQRVRQKLFRGYTTGNFAHQMRGVAGRVMYGKPYAIPGGRAILTGTSTTAVPYELYWELGHQNLFTRRYQRNEVWRLTGQETGPQVERIIARNIASRLGAAPTIRVGFGVPPVRTR